MAPRSLPPGYNYPSKSYVRRPDPSAAKPGLDWGLFARQAARASWIAPILVLFLGMCTGTVPRKDPTTVLILTSLNLIILVIGFLLGVFALAGMKSWGTQGVLAPALVGVTIFGLMVLAMIAFWNSPARRTAGGAGAAGSNQSTSLAQLQKDARDSFLEGGWLSVVDYQQATLTIGTLRDDGALAKEFRDNLSTPTSIALISVDNTGPSAITIDNVTPIIEFNDNTVAPAPSFAPTLQSAKTEGAKLLSLYSPPFKIAPGAQLKGKLLFLPPGIDVNTIRSITLSVDSKPLAFSGRFYTSTEKTHLLNAAGK